jgi:glycosyltransferase involved in cell wall biosynthesis
MLTESTKIQNVSILIRALKSGGAEKQSVLLAKALNDDYRVFLVVQRGNVVEQKFIDFISENGLNLVLLKGSLYQRLNTFYKFLRKENIEIIFSYLPSDNFWSGIIGKIARVRFLVGGIRSIKLPLHKYPIIKFLHLFIHDYTIFNSYSAYQRFVRKGFKRKKSVVLTNCIELIPSPIVRNQNNPVKILTVARFTNQKDYYTALKSIQFFLLNFYPHEIQIHYQIVGFGVLEERIRQWIHDLDLSDHVTLLINPPNISELFRNADIYFSTSIFEGFSNSIMEAMNHSLPVVATDVGDNNMLVINEKTGYLTPKYDFKTMAEHLADLIRYPEKRNLFGEAGYHLLKAKCSIDSFRNNYIVFLDSLVV